MTKNFEHKIVCVAGATEPEGGHYPNGPVALALNSAGREDWELVSVLANPGGGFFAFFRRVESYSSSI